MDSSILSKQCFIQGMQMFFQCVEEGLAMCLPISTARVGYGAYRASLPSVLHVSAVFTMALSYLYLT